MKASAVSLLAILCASLSSTLAADAIVEFSAVQKRFDRKTKDHSNSTTVMERYGYEVTVKNKTFKDTPPFEVKYAIFYSDSTPGSKKDPALKQKKGSHSIEGLARFGSVQFDTDPLTIQKVALDPGWHWNSGASTVSKDSVRGIWIRAYLDGNVVGEYVNPTTISKGREWKD
jgi:hypothetical protein